MSHETTGKPFGLFCILAVSWSPNVFGSAAEDGHARIAAPVSALGYTPIQQDRQFRLEPPYNTKALRGRSLLLRSSLREKARTTRRKDQKGKMKRPRRRKSLSLKSM